MSTITPEQLNAALLERLAKLNEVSDHAQIHISVAGNRDIPAEIRIRVCTRHTELTDACSDIDHAISEELARHANPKSAADEMREKASDLIRRATALEAESLPA